MDMITNKEKIDYVIKHFDFEKVHKVMKFLKWEYYSKGGRGNTPSLKILKERARELLNDVAKKKCNYSISSGGFKASKIRYQESNSKIETIFNLEFIVTSYDSLFC